MAVDTFYLNAGGSGSRRSDASPYSTVHDATTMTNDGYGADDAYTENEAYSSTFQIGRSFLSFDTSALPDNAVIESAVLRLYPVGTTRSGDGASCVIVQSTQASETSLVDGDWDQLGTVSGGSLAYSSMAAGAYREISLNATGLSWINKTGFTKLGIRDSGDISNTVPSAGTYNSLMYANGEGGANPPELVVTYSLPAILDKFFLVL